MSQPASLCVHGCCVQLGSTGRESESWVSYRSPYCEHRKPRPGGLIASELLAYRHISSIPKHTTEYDLLIELFIDLISYTDHYSCKRDYNLRTSQLIYKHPKPNSENIPKLASQPSILYFFKLEVFEGNVG